MGICKFKHHFQDAFFDILRKSWVFMSSPHTQYYSSHFIDLLRSMEGTENTFEYLSLIIVRR